MPRSPRTTTCVSSTALTATIQCSAADFAHGLVDLALGLGFLSVIHGADALANLFGDEAQAEPRGQHAFEDAQLSVLGQRNQPPTQIGDLGVVCLGGEAHALSLLRGGPKFIDGTASPLAR